MRRRMPQRSDRHFFKYTADRSRNINLDPVMYRGGIRL